MGARRGRARGEGLGRRGIWPRGGRRDAGACAAARPGGAGPERVERSTRATLAPGELFVGLPGEHADGGALRGAGARRRAPGACWSRPSTRAAAARGRLRGGAVLVARRTRSAALQALARAWRRELRVRGAMVVGDHRLDRQDLDEGHPRGAAGGSACAWRRARRTSTPRSACRWRCWARRRTREVLVLEMAMRGRGPDRGADGDRASRTSGVIVNVGPAHLELLGSLEAIAAAKAELIAGLRAGRERGGARGRAAAGAASARGPARRSRSATGGDVAAGGAPRGRVGADRRRAASEIDAAPVVLARRTTCATCCAAVAAARRARGHAARATCDVRFSAHARRSASSCPAGWCSIDDCYNANPMSMRAAIDDLAETAPGARAWRCSATCSSSGAEAPRLHREIGAHARARGRRAAGHGRPAGGRDRARRSAASSRGADARRGRGAARRAAARGRHGAREGLARRRPGARGRALGRRGAAGCALPGEARGRRSGGAALNGPDSLRGHGRAADLHLPQPQVHRVPAQARVRPAHPRGRPAGPPSEGRHADDGRDHHLPRGLGRRS